MNPVAEKARELALRLRTLSATHWGLRVPALKALHKRAVIPVTAYTASVWAHWLRENVGLAKTLNRAQRPTFLSMVGAYRTAPMEALHVLTGIMPLDLEVCKRSDLYGRRQAQSVLSPYRTLAEIDSDLLGEWQNRWELSGDGRVTFSFIPNIRWRLARFWFSLDHFSAQLVIGHGLSVRGLSASVRHSWRRALRLRWRFHGDVVAFTLALSAACRPAIAANGGLVPRGRPWAVGCRRPSVISPGHRGALGVRAGCIRTEREAL